MPNITISSTLDTFLSQSTARAARGAITAAATLPPPSRTIMESDLQCYRISCTTTNASTDITLTAGANKVLANGMTIHGAGIANGTTITNSVLSTTTVRMSAAATASATVWLTFLPAAQVGSFTITKTGNWNTAFLTKEQDANGNYTWTDTSTYSGAVMNIPPSWDAASGSYWLKNTGGILNRLGSGGDGSHRDLTLAAWTKTNVTTAKNVTGVDGTANAASTLTASAANGTCTYAVTSSGTGTFNAFIRRLTGYGRVWMTRDGGASYVDVTPSSKLLWKRVSVSSATTNPTVGFLIETNADAIQVDVCNDTNTSFLAEPYIGRPYDVPNQTITQVWDGATVQGRRYLLEYTVKTDGWAINPAVKLRNSGSTSYVNVNLVASGVFNGIGYATYSGSAIQYNSNYYGEPTVGYLPHSSPAWVPGDKVKLGLIFGMGQAAVMMSRNGGPYNLIGCDDQKKTDPAAMNTVDFTGDGLFYGFSVRELKSNNVICFGDSITAKASFTRSLRNAFDPLGWQFTNSGSGGDTLATQAGGGNRIAADVSAIYSSAANNNFCLLWMGTNDIAVATSAATCLTNAQTIVSAIKAANSAMRVICVEVLTKRTTFLTGISAANFTAAAVTFNAGLAALTGVEDVIPINDLTETQDASLTAYFSDGVHPTPALESIIVQRIAQYLK